MTGARAVSPVRKADERRNQVIFKTCASFSICKTEINKILMSNT